MEEVQNLSPAATSTSISTRTPFAETEDTLVKESSPEVKLKHCLSSRVMPHVTSQRPPSGTVYLLSSSSRKRIIFSPFLFPSPTVLNLFQFIVDVTSSFRGKAKSKVRF